MTHHENESIIDKVKSAFGMGGDDEHEGHDHGPGEHDHDHGTVAGDVENRPAGPDFGASAADADLGRGPVADPATTGFEEPRGESASRQSSVIDDEQPVDAERRDPVV